jgi:hypothetical protein
LFAGGRQGIAGAKITFVFTTPDGTLSTTSTFIEKLDTAQPYDAVATGEIREPAAWTMLTSALALGAGLRLRKS